MEELNFEEQYIRLSITNDGEGNPLCSIKLDDEQELVITAFEFVFKSVVIGFPPPSK